MVRTLSLAVLVAFFAQSDTEVRVFVFTKTDRSGFTDPIQAQRIEAFGHVRAMLERRKGIAVVDYASSADVHVEVLNAGQLETGAEVTRAGASTAMGAIVAESRTTKELKPQVHVRVSVGDYRIEYNGTDRRLKGAAQAVVEGIENWIKQNRGRLQAQRAK